MRIRLLGSVGVLGVAAGAALISSTTAFATPSRHSDQRTEGYVARVILTGSSLTHQVAGTPQPLSKPDDIVLLDGKLFVAFQNGVGPQGEPSSSGNNTASTLVELTGKGDVIWQWDLMGKIDGLGADRTSGTVVAAVNEDGNSSLYRIDPSTTGSRSAVHYLYDQNPLPHGGGTDGVTFMNGLMLISASAPTVSDGPAVYSVTLHPPVSPGGTGTASATTLFADNAPANPADSGAPSQLALTDPDSNIAVPSSAPRFGGDFMLDSQGDQQQVYVDDPGTSDQSLSVLQLSQSVNDTSFATDEDGTLFVTDASNNSVDTVKGPFQEGEALAAVTPCGSNNAPPTCPAPGFPANYLGAIDLNTGTVNQLSVSGASLTPQGTVFVGDQSNNQGDNQDTGQD